MRGVFREYRDTDGFRRWELLYEGVFLVLLSERAPVPYASELLAFRHDLQLAWRLSPQLGPEKDYIANVWIEEGQLWACSFSGYSHRLDPKTGNALETIFTK